MPGPFDLPQMPGGTGMMGDLFGPDFQKQRLWDAMGGLGMSLVQAGAPSPYPGGFGDLIGRGLAGAAQGMNANEDKYLKRALTGAQVEQARAKIAADKKFQDLLAGTGIAPPSAGGIAQPGYKQEVSPGNIQGGDDLAKARAAIGVVETGGHGNPYATIGPVSKMPDGTVAKPYGKYQVMDFNIGPWTQEVLGQPMTPEQFLANPQAQDKVFDAKFGQYMKAHGNPQDAASMWFTGQPRAKAGTTPDVLGTTPNAYVDKFNKAYGMPVGGAAPPLAGGQGDSMPGVVPAQYSPQQPKTLQEVVQTIPPGVRQLIGAMGREEGMKQLMKYADPETVPAIDARTGQVVFAPKSALNSGQFTPLDAQKLANENSRLDLDRQREARENANRNVIIGPDGRPIVNQQAVDAKTAISAAQGTDPVGKMLIGDYDDVRKANTEMQSAALIARTGLAQTNRLASLLDQVNTGRFTTPTQEIKQMAKGLGVNLEALGVKDDTAPAQAIQALRGQMALALRNPSQGAGMPGAMSDADRNYLDRMVAGLENTPEGNRLIIEASRKLYQRQIDMAKIANDFMRSKEAKTDPNALYQKLQDYADKNPLFSDKDVPAGGMSIAPPGAIPGQIPPPPAGFKVLGR